MTVQTLTIVVALLWAQGSDHARDAQQVAAHRAGSEGRDEPDEGSPSAERGSELSEVEHSVKFVEPGQSMVLNGDFADGRAWWDSRVVGAASGSWRFEGGIARADIDHGGLYPSDVRLGQGSMLLLEGKRYALEFREWAERPRALEAHIIASGGRDYSGLAPLMLTPVPTRYRREFAMSQSTDEAAQLAFDAGAADADIYLDDVSLIQLPE